MNASTLACEGGNAPIRTACGFTTRGVGPSIQSASAPTIDAHAERISSILWLAVVEHYDGLCAYCGVRPWEHRDHVIPLAVGGSHTLGNLLPACGGCNIRKATSTWNPIRPHPYETEGEAMTDKPGAALVRIRWAKTSKAQRSDHARMMSRARWDAYRQAKDRESAAENNRTEPEKPGKN